MKRRGIFITGPLATLEAIQTAEIIADLYTALEMLLTEARADCITNDGLENARRVLEKARAFGVAD